MDGMDDKRLAEVLSNQSKISLIQWIVEQAGSNSELRQALLEFVAPKADVDHLVSELGNAITRAWGKNRFDNQQWKLAGYIAGDLHSILAALEQLIERGCVIEAEDVLCQVIDSVEEGILDVDDSYGELTTVGQYATSLRGKAWAKTEPRVSSELAKVVFYEIQSDNYGIRDYMIRDFAPALGRDGLLALKALCVDEIKSRQVDETNDAWVLRRLWRQLADVADALGDVDMYIDIRRQCDQLEEYAYPIAERLFDVGRADEALEYLDRVGGEQQYRCSGKLDSTTLRCNILQALGRDDEACDTLWNEFLKYPSSRVLERLLAITPKKEQQKLLEKAITAVEAYENKLTAALFLMEHDRIEQAVRIITHNPEAFDGGFYGELLELAEPLREEYPAAAWILYRALLLDILERGRSKAYHHAVDYLNITSQLASRAGLAAEQRELMAHLQEKHGRKYSFWNSVNH